VDGVVRDIVSSRRLGLSVEVTANESGSVLRTRILARIEASPRRPVLRVSREIGEYLDGVRRSFSDQESIRRRISGVSGEFNRAVLLKTLQIPYGQTVTYSGLAASLGSRAYRAVGNALARNPIPILVPCHRVVAKRGIGGFGAGPDVKAKLLSLEGVTSLPAA